MLLGTANVTALTLAFYTNRRQEFMIRAALGASRGALFYQTMIETIVLFLLGGALSLGKLAGWQLSSDRAELVAR